jgi:hypothetical protein
MTFISNMSWAQIVLIQLGVVLQVIAIRAILKRTSEYCDGSHHEEEETGEEAVPVTDPDKRTLEMAALYRPEQTPSHTISASDSFRDLKAGSIAKTAKVKFQSFKFRPH